jgi:hypothetical protein
MCTLRAPACLTALASTSATAKYTAASTGAGERPGRSMSTVVATGVSSASARIASPRPRSASTGGLIPATRPRSSASALAEFSRASATRATAVSGSVLISPSVARSEMPSAIRRAWAPSCRSRSILDDRDEAVLAHLGEQCLVDRFEPARVDHGSPDPAAGELVRYLQAGDCHLPGADYKDVGGMAWLGIAQYVHGRPSPQVTVPGR